MPDTINNESTPSLVGASVRSVQDQERDAELSLSSSRSPSKSNQKKGISHHDDYTSVNELVDEGALIHDEQAYDDLLDDTGKLRPSVSQTREELDLENTFSEEEAEDGVFIDGPQITFEPEAEPADPPKAGKADSSLIEGGGAATTGFTSSVVEASLDSSLSETLPFNS